MLKTHLSALPYTKFVLIQDSVTAKGWDLLEYLVKNHENHTDYRTHFFIFEHNFSRIKSKCGNIACHDFSSDPRNWLNQSKDFKTQITNLSDNCVIIVDSLVHVLYKYGLSEAYQIFAAIKNKSNVQQTVGLLHTDLLEDKDKILQYFQHLATLHMELEPKRISYIFKKGHRKIIKQVEEYRFENGRFINEKIKKPDKATKEDKISKIIPENMSTFKIGLSEKDKESRNSLVLPYLPKYGAPFAHFYITTIYNDLGHRELAWESGFCLENRELSSKEWKMMIQVETSTTLSIISTIGTRKIQTMT